MPRGALRTSICVVTSRYNSPIVIVNGNLQCQASAVCKDNHFVEELTGYFHQNPLRAVMIDSLVEINNYPWFGRLSASKIDFSISLQKML